MYEASGNQLSQVFETIVILAKQHQSVILIFAIFILQVDFSADNGFDSPLQAFPIEFDHRKYVM